MRADISNALVVYPPKSKINFETHQVLYVYCHLFTEFFLLLGLFPEQLTAVRVLQLGNGLAVCPPDM